MPKQLPIMDADAAAAGGFIPAVVGKMGALYGAAIEALEPLGVFEGVAANFAASWPSTAQAVPWADVWEQMAADDRGSFLLVVEGALGFIGSTVPPAEDQPWPIEFVAAHVLVDLFVLSERVRGLRRELVGRSTVDLHGFAEVVWISMRLGAMSEAFRAKIYGYASAVDEARVIVARDKSRNRKGGLGRGAQSTTTAHAWRSPFLEWLQKEIVAANSVRPEPMAGDDVLDYAEQNWPTRGFGSQQAKPRRSTLNDAIRWGTRAGMFKRPPAKRGRHKASGQPG